MTDTGSKYFDCALVSTLETYDDPENGSYVHYTYYVHYGKYYNYCDYFKLFLVGWLESVGSRVVYELYYKKPILYVVPIQSILGKLPLCL